ncbi:hypothetical protein E4U43_000188 [Claviceps pusilla]|uniref:Uncharacterized protein n=1 Tax=Claviceps pusilla TaxID=123648 RepID=A0A9P7NCB8_9HYPO|nr:hypothetical protein E4U43_000188 [Claviceps pusilla]
MARGNSAMERIRADLLGRARMERQQDEIDARADQVRQAGENTPCRAPTEGFNDESSRTPGVLPRWPTLTRSLTTTRRQKESPSFQDSDGLKLPAPSARPITIASSRYGEPGAPSSLPSPISWPQQMPDMPSRPVRTAEPSAYQSPRESLVNDVESHTSSSFAPSADNLMDESHLHQLSSSRPEEPVSEIQRGPKKHPERFLFCFPWVQSRRVRSQILTCFTSGVFLACLLAVYLGLALTDHISRGEVTIIIILVIFSATIFFCYSVIRLCLLVSRGHRARSERLPNMSAPRGYAVPPKPIHVVLARDEEAAGTESETSKSHPPAYGLWRESVRADPNRLFWQRNESVLPVAPQPGLRRPPSYASDDGISYIVEARPRSILPPSHAYVSVSALKSSKPA